MFVSHDFLSTSLYNYSPGNNDAAGSSSRAEIRAALQSHTNLQRPIRLVATKPISGTGLRYGNMLTKPRNNRKPSCESEDVGASGAALCGLGSDPSGRCRANRASRWVQRLCVVVKRITVPSGLGPSLRLPRWIISLLTEKTLANDKYCNI